MWFRLIIYKTTGKRSYITQDGDLLKLSIAVVKERAWGRKQEWQANHPKMIRFHSSHCRSSWRRKTTTSNFFLHSFLHLQHQSHAENGAGATMKVSIYLESTCSSVKRGNLPRTCVHAHRNIKIQNLDKFKIFNIYDQNKKKKKVSFKVTYKNSYQNNEDKQVAIKRSS